MSIPRLLDIPATEALNHSPKRLLDMVFAAFPLLELKLLAEAG